MRDSCTARHHKHACSTAKGLPGRTYAGAGAGWYMLARCAPANGYSSRASRARSPAAAGWVETVRQHAAVAGQVQARKCSLLLLLLADKQGRTSMS